MAKPHAKNHTTTLRLDDDALVRLQHMVADNPLYSNERVMRGASLALSRLFDTERLDCIMTAAQGGVDEL
ncbi:hypothetical protein [Serratia liquefaciens]|uniref:hypothetical protein n=1 Tax=Serratia liquefaciens TaxID=614 RepID=UPI00301CF3A2